MEVCTVEAQESAGRFVADIRHVNPQFAAEVAAGQGSMLFKHGRVRAGKKQLAAEFARARPQIDDAIRGLDGVGIVFDNQHSIAQIAERLENVDEPLRVAGMETDGRFVENVERADEMRTERSCKLNALRFSAGERGGQAVQREVVETHLIKKLQARANFFQDSVRDFQVPFGELQGGKKNARFLDGKLANLRDGFLRHAHRARLGAQASPATLRAGRITTEAAEENADVQLVFLALQPGEKTFDPCVVVLRIAIENQAALFGSELTPRHVGGNSAPARPLFCFLEKHAIARLGPRLDGAVVQRLAGIGDHQIQIEIDGIPEAMAAGACSVRIVKREKPGLRLLVESSIVLAFKSFVEAEPLGGIAGAVRGEFKNGFALPFAVTNLDGIHETRARLRIDGQAVHQHV